MSLRFLVNNAERVDLSGLEVDLEAALSDRFSAAASASYVDARYDLYTHGSCSFDKLPDSVDGTACDLSGRSLPLAPKTKARLNLSYRRPIRHGSLFAGVDWSWSSDYHTNASLDTRHIQAAYRLVNVRVGYRLGKLEVTAWIRNAGDETIVMREGPSNLFPRDPAYGRFFTMPRSFGLTLSARH